MRTKFKYFFVILTVLLCFFLTACDKTTYYWEVAQSVENISKIEILEEDGVTNAEDQLFICEIASEYYEEVVNDVQAMPAHKFFGPPGRTFGKIIKISFADGMWDEIALIGSSHVTDPLNPFESITPLGYDNEDFNQLIEKWIAKSSI